MPDAAQFTLALFDSTGLGTSVQAPARVHAADVADLHEADAESPPQLGTAPRGTATSGLRRDPNPSSCRRCFASSGTSNGWNDWPHSPRHPRRPQHERPHRGTGEMEPMCGSAQAPHRRLSPRVDGRSKPVSVPLPHPRFAVQPRTRACHDRRSAVGSRRFRVASLPRRPRRSGAGGPDTGFR